MKRLLRRLLLPAWLWSFVACGSANVQTIEEAVTATACPNPDPKSAIYCNTNTIDYRAVVMCTWACALHLQTAGTWTATFRPVGDCWEGPEFERTGDCS